MSQSLDIEQDAPGAVRSPRQSRAQRPTLAGLDLDPEGEDDEYNEEFEDTAIKDEDDDELEEEGDAEEDAGEDAGDAAQPPKKKRGRKRKAATQEPEAAKAGGKLDTAGEDEDGDRAKAEPADGDKAGPGRKKGKKRGRKPKIPRPEDVIFDDKGNEINVQNDEVVLEDEDPQGRAKIDELGFLQGGRTFRIKTFTLLGKGERQYMVSTEPARLVGFRDSYLLFKTHLTLFKKVCTHDEKMDLINRQLIPTSYKGRAVNLVTARSIFREFGARMLVGGKKVTDDFWEQKARDRGDVEGDPADPEEAAVKVPSYNAADHNAYLAQVTGSALINYQTDATWMYQVAQQTVDYNKQLADARAQAWLRGVKDTYSGFNFYPGASQPRRAQLAKLRGAADDRSFDCTVRFFHPNVRRTATGLASVPRDVLDCIEDGAVKRAVLEQQQFERSIQR